MSSSPTSPDALPAEAALLTIADWRAAWRQGAPVRALLQARLRRLASAPAAPVWILRLDADALAPRIAELERLDAAAASRDELLAAYPLFGVPFAVKDNIDAAGLPTTAACPAFSQVPGRNAGAVQRLLDAGALLVGKTNLDQFATGLVGTRSPHGAPASVFAADRVSGGSSSGSAVATARGDVAFALGTDTAGSGRVPAAFNNLVGLKPTPGRVSTAGVLPACRSLDCVSVFALDAADAATVLALIEGPDAADDYSRFTPGARDWARPLRVGIPAPAVLDDTPGYRGAWDDAVAALRALHPLVAEVVPVDFTPLHEVAALLYDGPWVAERYAVVQPLIERHPDAMDSMVAAVISRARGHSAVDAFRGQYRLQAGRAAAAALWQQVDLLMVPSAPGHPSFDDVAADPLGANARLGLYTNFVNLLGMAALAMPSGFTAGGLPFGVTFIAPGDSDAALVRWGGRWQAARALPLAGSGRAWTPPPPPAREPAAAPMLTIAVVGAHLSGLPLNGQLTERGGLLREATTTAARYRLFELPGTRPRKPGLLRVGAGGTAIALELWDLPLAQVGSFLALIPSPLGLGTIELADGRLVHGFLCEPLALEGARDISSHGGWRVWLASAAAD